jgi:hypothetical protein
LVKKSSHQLITFCRNGSEDWTSPVRISSAQLLYAVFKEIGPEVAEELNDVMELIVHQSGDREASIAAIVMHVEIRFLRNRIPLFLFFRLLRLQNCLGNPLPRKQLNGWPV